jgi:hypothetical protein
MILILLASLAALEAALIVVLLRRRAGDAPPENSHPGRVLPKGVPIGHALKDHPEPPLEPPEPEGHIPNRPAEPRNALPVGDPKEASLHVQGILRKLLGPPTPRYSPVEQALLGAMLLDDRQIPAVLRIVTGSLMLIEPRHRMIFLTLRRLDLEGAPVSPVALRHELALNGLLDACGGAGYLMELMEAVPNPRHAADYAIMVREAYFRTNA